MAARGSALNAVNTTESGQLAQTQAWLRDFQNVLIEQLQGADPEGIFGRDPWQSELGQGLTAICESEDKQRLWERALVGFSDVGGDRLPEAASERRPELAGQPWRATGVSVVVHPTSPWIPASHLNLRYFSAGAAWWFGGGFDLTPCYPDEDDCRLWHRAASDAVEAFGDGLYAEFKQNCDRYFFLPHRGEMRGIGGLFFDDFNRLPFADCLAMIQRIGQAYQKTYLQIAERHRDKAWTAAQRWFQLLRRGRYAEFNLALDRGTRFGLTSGGRTESILGSMPPKARWQYNFQPEADSPEARLSEFLQPRDWLKSTG